MNNPRRLLEMQPEGLERELLECGRDDGVPAQSRDRIWAGVVGAIGTALPATTSAAAAGASAGAAASGPAGAATAGAAVKLGLGWLGSWVGVGLLGGAVLAGGAAYTAESGGSAHRLLTGPSTGESRAANPRWVTSTERGQQPAPRPTGSVTEQGNGTEGSSSEAVASGRAKPAPLRRPEPSVASARRPEPGPVAAVEDPDAAPMPAPPVAQVGPEALEREVKMLDVARRALRSGDVEAAARELGEHRRNFAGGVLAPEAEVMRIELLLKRGDRSGAVAAARSFLASQASSPHAARVRAVLAAAGAH